MFKWILVPSGYKNVLQNIGPARTICMSLLRSWMTWINLGKVLYRPEEVDIGDGSVSRPTFINKNLKADCKAKLIELLKEYVCCFAWEYHEMPGLSRELVEHPLPIKASFRPYKQSARKFNPKTYDRIKEEIGRLLKANFIRPCRYAEWISNIVLVEKKGSGKLRV